MATFYHYVRKEKYKQILKDKCLKPTAPFNPRIKREDWKEYVKSFGFPLAKFYTCCFFEPKPKSWIEYGLFNLLMKEFPKGSKLLKISVEDNKKKPIVVRDHGVYSPKSYNLPPEIWKHGKIRETKPQFRERWLKSTIPLRDYEGSHLCPEVLLPFKIDLKNIKVVKTIG